jgi:hypothetical protein
VLVHFHGNLQEITGPVAQGHLLHSHLGEILCLPFHPERPALSLLPEPQALFPFHLLDQGARFLCLHPCDHPVLYRIQKHLLDQAPSWINIFTFVSFVSLTYILVLFMYIMAS